MASERKKARIRLGLRAEKAMGLPVIDRRLAVQSAQSKPPAPVAAATPSSAPHRPGSAPAWPDAKNQPATDRAPVWSSSAKTTIAAAPPVAPLSNVPLNMADPFTSAVLGRDEKIAALAQLDEQEVKICRKCRLWKTRTNTVFGEGDPDARLFFIGEGPGENEDLQGRPFVGRAGDKLTEMIIAMKLSRQEVYIANIVKCRPPENRVPAGDEVIACTPYLLRQLEIVRPQVIVTLGLPATQYMLQTKLAMNKMRGQWHWWRGIKLMPTYHPSYILRNYTKDTRQKVWDDLQLVMKELGLTNGSKKQG